MQESSLSHIIDLLTLFNEKLSKNICYCFRIRPLDSKNSSLYQDGKDSDKQIELCENNHKGLLVSLSSRLQS